MAMRGVETRIQEIRHRIFTEAADQRHQVRVPRLQGERGHGHGRLSGLHGASVR